MGKVTGAGKIVFDSQENIDDQNIVIPVIREEVVVDSKKVVNATVTIQKNISSEEVVVEVPLITEQLNLEHVAVNQFIDSKPEIRYEGDAIIIPVTKEVVVKRLFLVEEIRVTTKIQSSDYAEKVTLKKEEVKVTRENKG